MSELGAYLPQGAVDAITALVSSEVERQLGDRRLVTIREFAHKAGLTEKAIRRRVERGQLQVVRVGARLLVPLTELDGPPKMRGVLECANEGTVLSQPPATGSSELETGDRSEQRHP